MESQPQNPEFRIHPENFHPCIQLSNTQLNGIPSPLFTKIIICFHLLMTFCSLYCKQYGPRLGFSRFIEFAPLIKIFWNAFEYKQRT